MFGCSGKTASVARGTDKPWGPGSDWPGDACVLKSLSCSTEVLERDTSRNKSTMHNMHSAFYMSGQ